MQLLLALRAFVRVLSDRSVAQRVAEVLQGKPAPDKEKKTDLDSPSAPKVNTASRNDALTLLATLQREA